MCRLHHWGEITHWKLLGLLVSTQMSGLHRPSFCCSVSAAHHAHSLLKASQEGLRLSTVQSCISESLVLTCSFLPLLCLFLIPQMFKFVARLQFSSWTFPLDLTSGHFLLPGSSFFTVWSPSVNLGPLFLELFYLRVTSPRLSYPGLIPAWASLYKLLKKPPWNLATWHNKRDSLE